MTFTLNRVSVVLLVAILSTPAAPAAAQDRTKTDGEDFRMFLHTISLRRNARVCERDVPQYGKTFADLYRKWSERHRAEVSRGESIFRAALKASDLKAFPYTNRAALTRAEETLDELSQPPQSTGPATPEAQTISGCDKLLTFLRTN
jgi:hypothetical protein